MEENKACATKVALEEIKRERVMAIDRLMPRRNKVKRTIGGYPIDCFDPRIDHAWYNSPLFDYHNGIKAVLPLNYAVLAAFDGTSIEY